MAQIAILAVTAVMALNEGAQKRKLEYAKAKGLTEAGHRRMAATSAEVAEAARVKERMAGRAISVAAASGGGVDDPTMVNLLGDLNAEGEYRMMAKLYVGSDEAMGIYHEADMAMAQGEAEMEKGYANFAKTLMSAYGSYGEMGKEFSGTMKKFGGKVKSVYQGAMHNSRASRSSLGMMDYTGSAADIYGGMNA